MSNSAPPPGWGAPSGDFYGTQPGTPAPVWIYAGFWWRVWAFLIDGIILGAIETVLGFFVAPNVTVDWQELPIDGSGQSMNVVDVASFVQPENISVLIPHIHTGPWPLASLLLALIPAIYYVLFEASSLRGTPGKRVCRLEVVTLSGGQISLAQAILRFVIKAFISFPLLYIGVIMVAFTRRKQGLHDLIAGTLVIRAETQQVAPFQPHR
ncbi:hypothetical protein WSS15_00370 [Acetobacter pasteurianus]|uniref:RDD domain-containing protein n=3 Tax=Acetobacter pasteurianus TaxID=438 RepID=C7JGZ4_ACEP3|nr:RDD family protein [Acetobacter pasteurianus]ASC05696.1 hypothetical protein S101468_01441 [Acetobacter pasteurianus subsp. pasteurianus]BAI00729.1 hypothetical protein APA01_26320 [Acetobacter pasteurianus IFO 3283-01]BAI03778.1 hypothetical protein APA03_26320 [Acetobacter pasteurianus IFO 3283-03]BAI06825.1 hypothetical protein APA07_26320 [Acetobacter pasteurianus IFO 3283-07]BAI09873.1 hypothetical protein APA22_26320 [Acetobacter pasteurianus IFO 3283-22]